MGYCPRCQVCICRHILLLLAPYQDKKGAEQGGGWGGGEGEEEGGGGGEELVAEGGWQVQAAPHLSLQVEDDKDRGVDVGRFVEHEHCGR